MVYFVYHLLTMGSKMSRKAKHDSTKTIYVYRKSTLEKITKIFATGNETCVVINIDSKDHLNAYDFCNYVRNFGYTAEYNWSWSADTGFSGMLVISLQFTDKIKRTSFNKKKQCCRCFDQFDENTKTHKFRCGHKAHK